MTLHDPVFRAVALRFRFELERTLPVPFEKYGNVMRGAFGLACFAAGQGELFEGKTYADRAPGGMRAAPRPFVLRVDREGRLLVLRVHLLGAEAAGLVPVIHDVVARMAKAGLGPGRNECRVTEEAPAEKVEISLAPDSGAPGRIRVRFLTPTELKAGGDVVAGAPFAALFARARDRVLFFTQVEDAAALARELALAAARIRTVAEDLREVVAERKSTRTGQRHSIGGIVGYADYEGDFRVLLPWLRAAEWTGVGRQTVWGKGHIHCDELTAAHF